MSDSLFS